jgi:starch phosphorylase
MIRRVFDAAAKLKPDVRVVYLSEYDMDLARLLTSGADLWLNTPLPPMEASGTSGMKAAMNGVPSLSVPDGWWLEGCIEGATGWAIGEDHNGAPPPAPERNARDAAALYEKLGGTVMPLYYGNRAAWLEVMVHTIALNGSFFNTQRMVQQYVLKAYFS